MEVVHGGCDVKIPVFFTVELTVDTLVTLVWALFVFIPQDKNVHITLKKCISSAVTKIYH